MSRPHTHTMSTAATALAMALVLSATPALAQFLEVEPKLQIVSATTSHRLLRSTSPIATLDLPLNYVFQFNLTTGTTVLASWQNIIHVTGTGNNCCANGDRVPGLWWAANTRQLYLTDGQTVGNGNDECVGAAPFIMNASSSYVVRIELLATQTRLFVDSNLICAETRTGRRPWSNALVYLSNPWDTAADATVSDFWFQTSQVAQGYDTFNIIGPNFVQLTPGFSPGAVAIPLDYDLGFDIMPGPTTNSGWSNILQVSATGGSCCNYGDRIPAIWFRANTRTLYVIDGHFQFGNTGGGTSGNDECPGLPDLPQGVTTNFRMTMNLTGVYVYINGTMACTEPRNDRANFDAAQVWVSNPWNPSADVQLANLYIRNNLFVPENTTISPPVVANAQMIAQLSIGQASLADAASQITIATQSIYSQYLIEASQLSTVLMQVSAAAVAQSSTNAAMSQQISQIAVSQSQMASTIMAAVAALPVASPGSGSLTSTPRVSTDSQGIHVNGGGMPISLEGECGAVNPCGVLRALNALRQL